jgi:hypothetical protein
LRTLNNFYEVVGFAKIPGNELWQIVRHFEKKLSDPKVDNSKFNKDLNLKGSNSKINFKRKLENLKAHF